MENKITMLDFVNYMDGFAEGKEEMEETQMSERTGHRKTNKKEFVIPARKQTKAIRRKKGIVKSKSRLNVLKDIADYEPVDIATHGIVRNHQLELVKPGNNLGNSRANKRREDSHKSKVEMV